MNLMHKKTRQLIELSFLGVIMFVSKIIMEAMPNIHLVSVLTIAYTLSYKEKALVPIYLFVVLNGISAGFAIWWIPYLYIWTILWAATMILSKFVCEAHAVIVYQIVCALHGLFFGILYAPINALLWGMSFSEMVSWIIAGIPYDCIHAAGNLFAGTLIIPISKLINKLGAVHRDV